MTGQGKRMSEVVPRYLETLARGSAHSLGRGQFPPPYSMNAIAFLRSFLEVCGLCTSLLRGGSRRWEWCWRAAAVEYRGATHAFNAHMQARKSDSYPSVLSRHCLR